MRILRLRLQPHSRATPARRPQRAWRRRLPRAHRLTHAPRAERVRSSRSIAVCNANAASDSGHHIPNVNACALTTASTDAQRLALPGLVWCHMSAFQKVGDRKGSRARCSSSCTVSRCNRFREKGQPAPSCSCPSHSNERARTNAPRDYSRLPRRSHVFRMRPSGTLDHGLPCPSLVARTTRSRRGR